MPIGGGRILPSPAQFYLTGEDQLRIVSACALTGVTIEIRARIADFEGETKAEKWTHIPFTNRSVRTEDFPLGTGSLLNVTAFASGATPRIGQAYVQIQLIRGFGTGALVLGTILGGYVTSTQAMGWPGSPIQHSLESGGYTRTINGSAPAAGVDINETVPTGAEWQLLMLQAQLTTAAGGTNRIPVLNLAPDGTQLSVSATPTTVAPSASGTFNWNIGMPLAVQVQPGINIGGLPTEIRMHAGGSFFIQTSALAAGDQWSAPRYLVREWLEVT